jgi:alkylation response protein AidB-like acyl-CoA dehydrogenase
LNNARYGIAWGVIGALEGALELTRTYALERHQFGNPLAKYQLVQVKLAQAATDAAYGLLAAWHVGKLKDSGGLATEMVSMIKRQNCDRALVGTRVLQEVFGGNAVSDEYHIGRIGHNLHVVQTVQPLIKELIVVRGTVRYSCADTWTCNHWDSGILLSTSQMFQRFPVAYIMHIKCKAK